MPDNRDLRVSRAAEWRNVAVYMAPVLDLILASGKEVRPGAALI